MKVYQMIKNGMMLVSIVQLVSIGTAFTTEPSLIAREEYNRGGGVQQNYHPQEHYNHGDYNNEYHRGAVDVNGNGDENQGNPDVIVVPEQQSGPTENPSDGNNGN